MPRYRYTAYDPQGNAVSGEVEATGEPAAVQALRREGLVPVQLRPGIEKKTGSGKSDRRVPLEDHLLFCRSLASYLRGGLTLSHVLVLLAKQSPGSGLRNLYTRLREDVEGWTPIVRAGNIAATD